MNPIERIQSKYQTLSKGQKKLAQYLNRHSEEAAFLTAARLGEKAGVSESTVVRFAMLLGYKGYPQLQEDFAKQVQGNMEAAKRLAAGQRREDADELLSKTLEDDMLRLEITLKAAGKEAFETATAMIDEADHVYIVGLRRSYALAYTLYEDLRMIRPGVILVNANSEQELIEQLMDIGPGDALIGISFPRYSLRTLRAMEFANSRQAQILVITDQLRSPMTLYSSSVLTAACSMTTVAASLTSGMSLVNALTTKLALMHEDEVKRRVELLEKTMTDYRVGGADDIDYFSEQVSILPWEL